MQMTVRCQQCGRQFGVASHLFGKRVPCSVCGGTIDIPVAPDVAPLVEIPPPRPPRQTYSDFPPTVQTQSGADWSTPSRDPKSQWSDKRLLVLCAWVGVGVPVVLLCVIGLKNLLSSIKTDRAAFSTGGRVSQTVPHVGASVEEMSPGWTTPTEQQCREFALRLEEIVISGDNRGFQQLFDWEAIVDRAVSGIELSEKDRNRAQPLFERAARESGVQLAQMIVEHVAGGGSYRLLHVHSHQDQMRVLFRMLTAEDGFNYHDIIVAVQADGQVRIVDMHVYLSGELLSQSLRRSWLPAIAEMSKSSLARLTTGENEFVAHGMDVLKMATLFRQGRHQEVLNLYRRLPKSLREDKSLMLVRLQSAMQTDLAGYERAIDDYLRLFPGDPSLDVVAIDGYLLKGQFERCLESVDRLDVSVGTDPFLDVLRATIYIEMQQYDRAKQCARAFIEYDGELVDPYWKLVDVSLAEKDFDATVGLLEEIERKFDLEFGNINSAPAYRDFVRSPQYQQWLNR